MNEHLIQYITTCEALYPEPVESHLRSQNTTRTLIGPDVWVGAHAVIMKGVKVGVGAVIGAGAIVTKDVPPYAIVAGVPARRIGDRFPENDTQALLESRWWQRDPREIKTILGRIAYPGPDVVRRFCEEVRQVAAAGT